MKRITILLATLAIILAGCSKDDVSDETSQEPIAFKEGQKVTFTASVKLPSTRAKTNLDGTSIYTKWESGDVALLSVGGKSANFTVTSIDESGKATFEGIMPASGTTFNLQYPASTPDLTTQEYTDGEALPKNKMLYKAENCSLNATASLAAQYAVLNVILFGVRTKVGMIKVTKGSTDTFTLKFKTPKQLSAKKTPLFMIMPIGKYNFKVEVYDASATPKLITSFTTTTQQTFSTDEFINIQEQAIYECVDLGLSVKWATCNVGASQPEEDGDCFAWGETEPYYTTQSPLEWKTDKTGGYCWQSYCNNSKFTEWATPPYDSSTKVLTSTYDAATANWGSGWRMPTKAEWEELKNADNCDWEWYDTTKTEFNGVAGYKVTSKKPNYTGNFIFLPAAGYRFGTYLSGAGSDGLYWSSSLDTSLSSSAWYFGFTSSLCYMYYDGRSSGRPVRPVQ